MVGFDRMLAALYAVVDTVFSSSLAAMTAWPRSISHQKEFVDRGAQRIFRVHHVAETDTAALREQPLLAGFG
jgi:hypothetical protein